MSSPTRSSLRIAMALLAVVAVALAGWAIFEQWREFRASGARLQPRWTLILTSASLVFAAYAVLIETWRRTVAAWDSRLRWGDAARIWFISNLGRYLPGKVWQIGAMGVMARERGVSALAATGSAIVINLVNLLAGFGVVVVTGAELFDRRGLVVVAAGSLAIAVLLAPRLLPVLGRAASAIMGRTVTIPTLPDRAIWIAALGCLIAWVLYGVAFQIFVAGVLGEAPGNTASYVAAFTGSYLLGYIAVFAPGGIGARELSLVTALGRLGLAAGGTAGIVALASRAWLTVLEVLPGVLLLGLDWARGARPSASRHAPDP